MNNQLLSIVVAMNHDNVIGVNNQLPWHIPEDLKHFKQVTMGKPVLMGRKTFDSIGRLLPGRKNIIVTKNKDFMVDGASIYHSLESALEHNQDYPELCIIGGGQIFTELLPKVNRLYLTIIEYKVEKANITYFPKIDFASWQLINNDKIIASNGINCEFKTYDRVQD